MFTHSSGAAILPVRSFVFSGPVLSWQLTRTIPTAPPPLPDPFIMFCFLMAEFTLQLSSQEVLHSYPQRRSGRTVLTWSQESSLLPPGTSLQFYVFIARKVRHSHRLSISIVFLTYNMHTLQAILRPLLSIILFLYFSYATSHQ